MSAYENVRVVADCEACSASGRVSTFAPNGIPAFGQCVPCDGTGHVEVPVSEWADALRTVEGIEAVNVYRLSAHVIGDVAARASRWLQAIPGVAINGAHDRARAVVLPASASTREDGAR